MKFVWLALLQFIMYPLTPTTMNSSVTKLYEKSLDKNKKSGKRLVWKPPSITPATPLQKRRGSVVAIILR